MHINHDGLIGEILDIRGDKFDIGNTVCAFLPYYFVPQHEGFAMWTIDELPDAIKEAIVKKWFFVQSGESKELEAANKRLAEFHETCKYLGSKNAELESQLADLSVARKRIADLERENEELMEKVAEQTAWINSHL